MAMASDDDGRFPIVGPRQWGTPTFTNTDLRGIVVDSVADAKKAVGEALLGPRGERGALNVIKNLPNRFKPLSKEGITDQFGVSLESARENNIQIPPIDKLVYNPATEQAGASVAWFQAVLENKQLIQLVTPGGGGTSGGGTNPDGWFKRNAGRIPFISTTEGGFLNLNIKRFLSVLAGAVAGSWFSGLANGVETIYTGLIIEPLDALSGFLSAVVASLSDTPATFIESAFTWQPPGDLIAFPIAVGVVLIGTWLLAETWEVTFG